ncbi:PaaI family thioesterase [Sphingomonas donggukensis]|uniref:PaaI family thioesterase n=1 Tax=Sphingomonas donggukensis TaxID=2949093 RepID=A0ABY4TYY0_9SPHN|nr:PaaI family thioesterase [Sphingomonas donggukensis]URW75756.1 PaaI family thioesterase [Sphingomonas donggukensis]
MTTTAPLFTYVDDPDNPGWKLWQATDPTRFNTMLGALSVRVDGGIARVRMTPEHRHSNLRDHVHGGALLGFIDVAMFAACRGFGVLTAGAAVTLDLSTQFIGGAEIGRPIEAQVELLRETGRMLFVRGLVVQDDTKVAAFSGTLRKSTPPKGIV